MQENMMRVRREGSKAGRDARMKTERKKGL